MEPLLKVGRAVRNAHIKSHVGQEQRGDKVVEAENLATRDSRPTADATLFLESTINRHTDSLTLRQMYGIDWTTFWRLKKSVDFVRVVPMYESVKLWRPGVFCDTGFPKGLAQQIRNVV
jgi:hypothetical protein